MITDLGIEASSLNVIHPNGTYCMIETDDLSQVAVSTFYVLYVLSEVRRRSFSSLIAVVGIRC